MKKIITAIGNDRLGKENYQQLIYIKTYNLLVIIC